MSESLPLKAKGLKEFIFAHKVLTAIVMLVVIGILGELASSASPKNTAAPTSAQSLVPVTSSASATVAVSPVPELTVRVPKLLGLSLAEARSNLSDAVTAAGSDAKLSLTVVYTYSNKPAGTVIKTGPSEFEKPGTKVTEAYGYFGVSLTIAKAIPLVPSLVGLKYRDAAHKLNSMGYDVKQKEQVSSQSVGTVIAQSVPGGERAIPSNTTIVLTTATPCPSNHMCYVVTSTGSGSAGITYTNKNGGTSQAIGVGLPWFLDLGTGYYIDFFYVSAQQNGSGVVTCTIWSGSSIYDRGSSSGLYSICTASD